MPRGPEQFAKVTIPREKVLARLGYAHGKTALDAVTAAIIDEEIGTAAKLLSPRQVIAVSPVETAVPATVKLAPKLTITSEHIFKLLDGCAQAYGFAVTIGGNLEKKRDRYLEEKETARALVLDAAGSVAAEELAELTHRQITDEAAKEGLAAGRRFSPGYGDWALAQQKDFLAWLGASSIGIRLTENFQMLPEKSVSAILGVRRP